MQIQERNIQTLHKLGLTLLQAKIYLVLVQGGKEKIQTISKITDTDRSNTYHAIAQLQQMGLVEKIIDYPSLYQAIPLQTGVSILLNRKKDQYNKIQREAYELNRIIRVDSPRAPEESSFKLIKRSRKTEMKDIINACNNTQECVDIVTNDKTFQSLMDLGEYHLKCIKRGVKYRIITKSVAFQSKKLGSFLKEPNFQMRCLPTPPKAEFAIHDHKSAMVILCPHLGLGNKSALFTSNPSCVEIFQKYFDTVWTEAKEYRLDKNGHHHKKDMLRVSPSL